MKDILDRIADSSPNESSDELICRLRDCAHEIEALRAALASRPNAQADEREAFEAWVTKEWPGLVIDRAPLTGFYKGDDGARLDDMWCAWRARAPALQATHAPHEKSDLYKEGYLAGKEAAQGVPVAWQVRRAGGRIDGVPIQWESCTKELYDATLATGRYAGYESGPRCEVRALCVAAAPSPDREQVGEATEAARIVKMWDDGFTQLAGSRAIELLRNASPSRECGEPPAENAGVRNKIATALHYPDHWDTAAYPTLDDAAWEAIASAKLTCSECGERQECPHGQDDGACGWCYDEKVASAPTLGQAVEQTVDRERWKRALSFAKGIISRLDTTEVMRSSVSGIAYDAAERAVFIRNLATEALAAPSSCNPKQPSRRG